MLSLSRIPECNIFYKIWEYKMSFFNIKDFLAGWIGGVTSLVIGHPFDTLKVRQQALGASLFGTFVTTLKVEGIPGFFKGIMFPMLTVGPSNAIFFGVYSNTMRQWEKTSKRDFKISLHDIESIKRTFFAGCFAGAWQALAMCPAEVVKINLQLKMKKSEFYPASRIIKDRGLTGLYRGFVPMLYRDVPPSGFYILAYELLLYSTFEDWRVPKVLKQIMAGGFAGVISWACILPFDFVKTRIQADNLQSPQYSGMMDCFKKSYKESGFRIFFKGFPVVMLRSFPVNAFIFLGYEASLWVFDRYNVFGGK